MKKVGVLTFHRANNVGAVLQNYALLKCLSSFCDAETINYFNEKIESENRIMYRKKFKSTIKMVLQLPAYISREKSFSKFRTDYLSISRKTYTHENIKDSIKEYDCFLVGSDQVWNTTLTNGDYTYFLDFVGKQKSKISYAGSFGSGLNSLNKKEIQLLKEFDYISVREYEAATVLNNMNIKADSVVDPTLLLDANEWQGLLKCNCSKADPYVLVYMVANTPKLIEQAKKYANERGIGIKMIHYGYRKVAGVENIRNVSPTMFLDLLYNAQCVFCSSFHAVCFSVIFHKQFMFGLDNSTVNNNSRLTNLCQLLGLSQRNIEIGEMNMPIDYNSVDQKLEKLRTLSLTNLKESVLKDEAND